MRFQLLGPLDVSTDGRPIEISRPKQRALLAALLLDSNRAVSSDRLLAMLWERDPPATGAKALQVLVSQLRKSLGEGRLETRAPGYLLRVGDGEYDVHEFEALVRRARGEPPARAAATLREALRLWRGEPLADFAGRGFAAAETARLEELRLEAVEQAVDAELESGRGAELVPELESLVSGHPLRERFRYQLMLALYRAGRQADALGEFRNARAAMLDELGLEPGRALRDLERAILGQEPSLDPVRHAGDAVPLEAASGVFVGRSAEMDALDAALDEVFGGVGRLVLLVGEPGIGKSRLADELIRTARLRGAQILVGRCWEAGGAPAYWPWVQSLRGYVRETDPAALRTALGARAAAEIAQIVPDLHAVFPGLAEPPSGDGEGVRLRLFDATAEFLRAAAAEVPIVLFLDDLHAADAPSLLLLQYLVRELRTIPILVLGAYRNVDPVPGQLLRTVLAEVAREPATRRLALGALSDADVAEYLDLVAGGEASPELAAALCEETEGHPLFMVEMVRLLTLDAGAVAHGAGREAAIPESLRDVISRRFMHLSPECNRVLVLAAVLGREFELAALSRLADVTDDELLETLDEALAARILTDVPGASGRLRFAHVLMRDSLYEDLTTARRVRLHRMVARTLTELYGGDPGAHLTELAHHSIAGSDFENGLDFARRAGDRALAMLAYEEAARLYRIAVDAAELASDDDTLHGELLLAEATAQIMGGEGPAARELLVEATEIARRLDDDELFARAVLAYGGRDIWGPRVEWDPRFLPMLEEALVRCGEGDSTLRAKLLARAASALRGAVDRDRPESLARDAVEVAERLGDESTLLYVLAGQLVATEGPADSEQRLRNGIELVRLAESLGDLERAFDGSEQVAYAAWTVGDLDAMATAVRSMQRLGDLLNLQTFRTLIAAYEATWAVSQGRLEEAERHIAHAFALGERAQSWNAETTLRLQTFSVRRQRGTLDGYEDVLRRSLDDYPGYWIFDCALALAYAVAGRRAECVETFERIAADGFRALSRDSDWLVNMCLLSEVCCHLEDHARAEQLAGLLSPFAALNGVAAAEIATGSVAHHVGRLLAHLERYDEAEELFETALTMNAHMGSECWLGLTRVDYARMLSARAGPGDNTRATVLRGQAR